MREIIVSQTELSNRNNPALVYIANLPSVNSQRVMRLTLNRIIRLLANDEIEISKDAYALFPWHELRYQETQAIRARLISDMPPTSANRHLAALRGVLKECWQLELMTAEEYQRAINLKNIKGETLPAGREIPDSELRAMLLSCYEDGKRGIRNLAALGILSTCGIRRAELEALTLSDFDPETGDLKIFGKGRKPRVVTVLNKARQVLDAWLAIRGDEPGALFYAFYPRGDKMKVGKKWRASDLYTFIVNRSKELGFEHTSPHDFRRMFIGNGLDAGIDAVLLTAITGHTSPDMLKRYDRRPQKARRSAQAKIDLPI